MDIRSHDGVPEKALVLAPNWLATVSKRKLPGPAELERLHAEFRNELPAIVERLALRQDEVQFVEYVKVATEWLRDRQQSA